MDHDNVEETEEIDIIREMIIQERNRVLAAQAATALILIGSGYAYYQLLKLRDRIEERMARKKEL